MQASISHSDLICKYFCELTVECGCFCLSVVLADADRPAELGMATQYPMTRLGFSVTELIARCIESIQAQRRGEEVPKMTILPVFFEHEF